MKQFIKIISKVDVDKQTKRTLLLEQDYELSTLFDAMQSDDTMQMDKSKRRLKEIQDELNGLNAYA